jgi:type I restriction enzyme S subunit
MSREGWKTYKLGDLCSKIGSGATPRGGKEAYLDEGPFTLIRSQNVLDFLCSTDGLAFISEEQANQLSNVELKGRDVLLNITGDSVARVCQIPSALLPGRVNQHVSIIRPDESKLLPEFLKYYLLNPSFKNYMLGLASVGGTRNALTKGMIEYFEIEVPPRDIQRRIAAILSALDEKTELNRQTNATLEAIAQAIFKEWFVDFHFPGATGEMQDSEFGPIPEGWNS